MFLQNVKCLLYGTLRYVTWRWKTRISWCSVAGKQEVFTLCICIMVQLLNREVFLKFWY